MLARGPSELSTMDSAAQNQAMQPSLLSGVALALLERKRQIFLPFFRRAHYQQNRRPYPNHTVGKLWGV